MQQFIDICDEHGYVKPSVYQGHYNPVVRGSEKELFPILRKNNISFFGFRCVSFDLLFENKQQISTAEKTEAYLLFDGTVLEQAASFNQPQPRPPVGARL